MMLKRKMAVEGQRPAVFLDHYMLLQHVLGILENALN